MSFNLTWKVKPIENFLNLILNDISICLDIFYRPMNEIL